MRGSARKRIKTKRRARSTEIRKSKNIRTRRNVRSLNQLRGFKELGRGVAGIVHRPPFPCANKKREYFEKYASDEYVSKLTDILEAEKELRISDIIREKIPNYADYYCLPEFICKSGLTSLRRGNNGNDSNSGNERGSYSNRNNNNGNRSRNSWSWNNNGSNSNNSNNDFEDRSTLLITKFCGLSLDSILDGKTNIELDSSYILYLINEFRYVITAVQQLHDNGIMHRDLHIGNIALTVPTKESNLKSGDFYKLLLLDFGLAIYYPDLSDPIRLPFILDDKRYDLLFLINEVLVPFSRRIVYNRSLAKSDDKRIRYVHTLLLEFIYDADERAREPKASMIADKKRDIEMFISVIKGFVDICDYVSETFE